MEADAPARGRGVTMAVKKGKVLDTMDKDDESKDTGMFPPINQNNSSLMSQAKLNQVAPENRASAGLESFGDSGFIPTAERKKTVKFDEDVNK